MAGKAAATRTTQCICDTGEVADYIVDFGTGYSSLSCLHQFYFDRWKIDRVFAIDLKSNHEKEKILPTIIDLAQALGIMTVAEGVEEEPQYRCLQKLGCHFGQGYLMGMPMQAESFRDIVKAEKHYI